MTFYYMRGVAPNEAREAVQGRNGRVAETAIMFRGDHYDLRRGFGMNKPGLPGVDAAVVDDFAVESHFYANTGAWQERYGGIDKTVHPGVRGYILIFGTEEPLEVDTERQSMYGERWRTTAFLPKGVERSLVGIVPAAPMKSASSTLPYADGDYGIFGQNLTIQAFTTLDTQINKMCP